MVKVRFRDFSHPVNLLQDQLEFTDGIPVPPRHVLLRALESIKITGEKTDNDVYNKNDGRKEKIAHGDIDADEKTKKHAGTHNSAKHAQHAPKMKKEDGVLDNTILDNNYDGGVGHEEKRSDHQNKSVVTATTQDQSSTISSEDVLHYKAVLARNDTVERARQLARALKIFLPHSKSVIGTAKLKGELESAFSKIVGKKESLQLTTKV